MSVHQLKDGRWVVRYRKGKNPSAPDSTAVYFGRGEDGRREAEALNNLLGFGLAMTSKQQSPTFVELLNQYHMAKDASLAATTIARLTVRMKGTILPEIGNLMAHELTAERLDRYVAGRRAKGVKNVSIHRELSDIRAVLRWAVRRRLLAANPMDGFVMPTLDNELIRPPSAAEFAAILAHAEPHLQRAMLLAYHTGLRPGREELLSLTWQAIDFIESTIMVVSAVKGGPPLRTVPLNAVILNHLTRWYGEDEARGGAGRIIHYFGAPVDSIKTAWKNAKKRAKIIRRLRLYDIRHAFVTRLLERGADLKTVSEIAGHASPEMTMSVYQHVNSRQKRVTVDLLVDDVPKKRPAKPRKH